MKKTVKVAAIHASYLDIPDEANPYSKAFDTDAPGRFVQANLDKTIAFMHEAGKNQADLVCTNEDFLAGGRYLRNLDYPEIFQSLSETIPGPTTQRLGKIARQYGMYIAANYYEQDGDRIYNTSVLIDRMGELEGKYRKVHPADGERWCTAGGEEFPVFKTDIGTIGFTICYDINFPEQTRSLAVKGANLIIHQTQGWGAGGRCSDVTGEAFMRTRAAENSVYFIVAKNKFIDNRGKSCIVDNWGNILAESQDEGLVIAEYVPDYDMIEEYNMDNYWAGVPSFSARAYLARRPALYTALTFEQQPVLERYKEMELATGEKAKDIIRKWQQVDENERKKYFS